MRRMLIFLAITAVCTACILQNSTSLSMTPPSTVAFTPTPSRPIKTDPLTKHPAVPVTLEAPAELPEYIEVPCWQIPVSSAMEVMPQGWSRYINAEYCFTFIYPSDWILVASQHFIALSKGTMLLVIGFRKSVEKTAIQRTGVGAGDIETVGTVVFLGQEISKELLVYEGSVHEVLYQYGTEISTNDLVFTISGGNHAVNYDLAVLEDEVIAIFDKIVESFQRIPPKKK